MVEGEVQGSEHMVVVFNLRTFGNGETEMLENLVDVAPDDGERVSASSHLVGGHTHVETGIVAVLALKLLQLLFHLFLHGVFQFVEQHAHLLSQFGGYALEVGKQARNHAFLAQKCDAEFLQGFFVISLELTHLF